jgi:hypothetical protein
MALQREVSIFLKILIALVARAGRARRRPVFIAPSRVS